jgi:hypothetical protein
MLVTLQPFAIAAFGAFFGALVALFTTMWREARQRRKSKTQALIDEYFSSGFLQHRIALSGLRRKVLSGEVKVDQTAGGYWYPGIDFYRGENIGALNEHQHLEFFHGFLVRNALANQSKELDLKEISCALKTSYLWHGDLCNSVAQHVRTQVVGSPGAELPYWVEAIEQVNKILHYDFKSKGMLANSV